MNRQTGHAVPVTSRLQFSGEEDKFELWMVKFKGHLRVQKLSSVLEQNGDNRGDNYEEKNALIYAELVQCLDDKSLSLIIRDCPDDGRAALELLRSHYLGSSKPRIICLYTELTSLTKQASESVTDYIIRVETAATSLKNAGEVVSDSLLIAMVLKGLPEEFRAFCTVITQKDETFSFSDFKTSLRSFEESKKCRTTQATADNIMNAVVIKCYNCGRTGHKKNQCKESIVEKVKPKRWCTNCKMNNHDTKYCRKVNNMKTTSVNECDYSESFAFKSAITENSAFKCSADSLLVDCGATAHIVNDKSKFCNFADNFDASSHIIELADGTRTSGIVTGKGDANFIINDSSNKPHEIVLKYVLYIPSYHQSILSVQAATEK